MRSRTRFYRVHLLAYDIVASCYWCFPPGVPILSPIPISAPISIGPSLQKRRKFPHKIRLVQA